ncbi:MAG: hypothetical protein ABEJ58_06815 [Halodesulfurarchaeum sp.]
MTQDPDRRPFRVVRSLLVAIPLAILVAAVGPTDPLAQGAVMAVSLVVALPVSYRLIAIRRYGPRELGAFFSVVLASVLLGLLVLPPLFPASIPRRIGSPIIAVCCILLADAVVFRVWGSGLDA